MERDRISLPASVSTGSCLPALASLSCGLRWPLLLLCVLFTLSNPARAQDPLPTARTSVSGTVTYGNGDPAPGIKISVLVTAQSPGGDGFDEIVVTDESGDYQAIHQLEVEPGTSLGVSVSALDAQGNVLAQSPTRTLVVGDTLTGVDLQIDGGLRISNFVSGPVCHYDNGTEEVCNQAEDIDIKGESYCDWSGEQRRCTWFGFQFDFENADPSVPIECDYMRSRASAEGNWERVREKNASTGSFTYELETSNGHFYNPMFELYSAPPGGAVIIVSTEFQCTYDGKPVFDMIFRARYSAR